MGKSIITIYLGSLPLYIPHVSMRAPRTADLLLGQVLCFEILQYLELNTFSHQVWEAGKKEKS